MNLSYGTDVKFQNSNKQHKRWEYNLQELLKKMIASW